MCRRRYPERKGARIPYWILKYRYGRFCHGSAVIVKKRVDRNNGWTGRLMV
ncbi:MAG: hypothetical protein ACE5GK_05695 [Nitrospiria bacterium]